MALLEHVQAYDELDMATMRLRLRLDDEQLPEERPAHIIEPAEVGMATVFHQHECHNVPVYDQGLEVSMFSSEC